MVCKEDIVRRGGDTWHVRMSKAITKLNIVTVVCLLDLLSQ